MHDRRQRPLRDLRISVTDRCNFRCTYCMPKEVFGRDFAFLPRDQLLTFEEITRLARAFAREGVSKIRLTGGEPLLRRDLEQLVAMLASIDEITDIALTTNGSALAAKAKTLKDAGLTRVSVSLDALDDETFTAMNDVAFPVARVLAGIDAAAAAGLTPVKINMVVKRGVNDHRITHMAERFRGAPVTSCASSNTWTSAPPTAGAWTTSSPPPRSSPRSTSAGRWNRWNRTTPARSHPATATATAPARSA